MKVWNYVFISIGVLLLLHLAGIQTAATSLFDLLNINFNADGTFQSFGINTSSLFDFIFGTSGILIGVGLAAGIIASLLTRAKPENLILVPLITSILVLFIGSLASVVSYAIGLGNTWIAAIIALIFIPFIAGYIFALAEFFRGTD